MRRPLYGERAPCTEIFNRGSALVHRRILLMCHCEAPKGPWQSHAPDSEFAEACLLSNWFLRDCHVGLRPPRNDKPVCFTPPNYYCNTCDCPWRSLPVKGTPHPYGGKAANGCAVSAATDAIGVYHFIDTQCELQALRRARHASPLQRTTGSPAALSTLHFPRKKSRTCVRDF